MFHCSQSYVLLSLALILCCLLSFLFHCRKVIRRPYRGVTRWNSDHKEVRATNLFMGDLQHALVLMLGEKECCDEHLLQGADGDSVDKMCPSCFQQVNKRFCISTSVAPNLLCCSQNSFKWMDRLLTLYLSTFELVLLSCASQDLFHGKLEVLTGCNKKETVLLDDATERDGHGRVELMHSCIATFRSVFADDLEKHTGLVDVNRENHIRTQSLKCQPTWQYHVFYTH
jgi:hypothetical protein